MSARKPVDLDAMTVAEFINRYYRPERLHAEPGRRARIIADREADMASQGSALISKHDSVTGAQVVLYSPTWRPEGYLRWAATHSPSDAREDQP